MKLQNYLMLIIYMIELCTSCVQAHKFSTQLQMLEILCPPMLFFFYSIHMLCKFSSFFLFQKLKSLKTIFFLTFFPSSTSDACPHAFFYYIDNLIYNSFSNTTSKFIAHDAQYHIPQSHSLQSWRMNVMLRHISISSLKFIQP